MLPLSPSALESKVKSGLEHTWGQDRWMRSRYRGSFLNALHSAFHKVVPLVAVDIMAFISEDPNYCDEHRHEKCWERSYFRQYDDRLGRLIDFCSLQIKDLDFVLSRKVMMASLDEGVSFAGHRVFPPAFLSALEHVIRLGGNVLELPVENSQIVLSYTNEAGGSGTYLFSASKVFEGVTDEDNIKGWLYIKMDPGVPKAQWFTYNVYTTGITLFPAGEHGVPLGYENQFYRKYGSKVLRDEVRRRVATTKPRLGFNSKYHCFDRVILNPGRAKLPEVQLLSAKYARRKEVAVLARNQIDNVAQSIVGHIIDKDIRNEQALRSFKKFEHEFNNQRESYNRYIAANCYASVYSKRGLKYPGEVPRPIVKASVSPRDKERMSTAYKSFQTGWENLQQEIIRYTLVTGEAPDSEFEVVNTVSPELLVMLETLHEKARKDRWESRGSHLYT